MNTDLAAAIAEIDLVDTHEHFAADGDFATDFPDVLAALFDRFARADLRCAGASAQAVSALEAGEPRSVAERFAAIEAHWRAMRHTGHGEAVALAARAVYGIERLDPDSLAEAQATHAQLIAHNESQRLLREVARLDHLQVDADPNLAATATVDGFVFPDLELKALCAGQYVTAYIGETTGIEVRDIRSLRQGIDAVFERFAPTSVALRAAPAGERSLAWTRRSDADAMAALDTLLRKPGHITAETHRVLGDWCWARCVERAIDHDLPFKLHTGYHTGNNRMQMGHADPALLCDLLMAYPRARFVLLHAGPVYTDQMLALAKHYTNVFADLCWAWAADPAGTRHFVRRFVHAVPATKLLGFGGDTDSPVMVAGYALQARRHLARALGAEVSAGLLDETQAIELARMICRENACAVFPIAQRRAAR
ncbi:MAG: amidohydrolase family protein [Planctomycetota bacterium]